MLVPASTVSVAGRASTGPSLRIVRLQPFEVRGLGFRPGDRVKVSLSAPSGGLVRFSTATRSGGFTTSFDTVTLSRCDAYAVTALDRSGTRVVLKAKPLCPPA